MKNIIALILLIRCAYSFSQETIVPFEEAYKRVYHITKISGEKPVIDGKLDEQIWNAQGDWSEIFVQTIPSERVPSDSPTRVKLFYDDKYIYIGVIAKDAYPNKINRFVGNRDDNSIGDLISIAFDTYHDFWAAPEFNLNVGGNKTDLVVTDKRSVNLSWNAVWEGRTHVSLADSCWTAELRIPFSQLRYNQKSEDGVWGMHIRRIIRRNGEVQNWSLIPSKNNGHVFSFGELHGMDALPKARNIEFLPYVMGKFQKEPSNSGPYQNGTLWRGNAGLDAKFGLSDFTLDVAVNPDYGQIELDPSVMNLTAYETFFDEKRPFFLEGKHILDFAFGNDMMFYSRRIGAAPAYQLQGIDNITSFSEHQDVVPIIAALKLTGTNSKGLTLGVVQSLTAKTFIKTTRNGIENKEVVEPLTNFSAIRIQKNWKGNTFLGGMVTSVNRMMDEQYLEDYLAANAITGGIDLTQYFNNRLYYIDFKGMFSTVTGTTAAIIRRQLDPVHYYQRISAQDYLGVDSTRRSLSGIGGYLKIGRKGNAKWNFSENFSWITPGFDLNDVGYLREADMLSNDTEISFQQTEIWKIFRSNILSFNQINKWNFDSQAYENNVMLGIKSMFINRYEVELNEKYTWNRIETRVLRGGPDLIIDPYYTTNVKANTDKSKRVMGSVQYVGEHSSNGHSAFNSLAPGLTFRIGNHIYLSSSFNYQWNFNDLQYVGQIADNNKNMHYLMGAMDQQTYGFTLRLQANITSDISLQFYGAPFTSTASFSSFKRDAQTMSHNYEQRYYEFKPDEIRLTNGNYHISERGNQYSFKSPDFSFNEFRSNVVVRWEYLPGSTLYFVWEHAMSNRENTYISRWTDNLDRMFGLSGTNTLMLKINYWFGL